MEELAYNHTSVDGTQDTYTIVEYSNHNSFDFMRNGDRVHRARKKGDIWVQEDGKDVEAEVLEALGRFMDTHHNK